MGQFPASTDQLSGGPGTVRWGFLASAGSRVSTNDGNALDLDSCLKFPANVGMRLSRPEAQSMVATCTGASVFFLLINVGSALNFSRFLLSRTALSCFIPGYV